MYMDWEAIINEASELISGAESIQRKLGMYANEVITTYGTKALKDFSDQLKEHSGVSRSPSTLHNYAWTYRTIQVYELPEDLPFSLCQAIAGDKEPQQWVNMVKQGLSPSEIRKQIIESKGKTPKNKVVVCPKCSTEISL